MRGRVPDVSDQPASPESATAWPVPNSAAAHEAEEPLTTPSVSPVSGSTISEERKTTVPKANSKRKDKTIKCKKCEFKATTKVEFWEHSRDHIKPEKALSCPNCPFVTEYNHHLDYHMRNHVGSKPFHCPKCDYNCVNKSMLKSHLKSHSRVHRYRCADCTYASKYLHSLKLHLQKRKHNPAVVLKADGSPDPEAYVDVYGKRRGPRTKSKDSTPPMEQVVKQPVLGPLHGTTQQLPFPLFAASPEAIANIILFQQTLQRIALEIQLSANRREDSSVGKHEDRALDLSKASEPNRPSTSDVAANSGTQEEGNDGITTMFENVTTVDETPKDIEQDLKMEPRKGNFDCQFCEITFGDPVLYTMHMGFHGFQNPFACNMCGEECADKIGFFLHIARTQHS